MSDEFDVLKEKQSKEEEHKAFKRDRSQSYSWMQKLT